MHVFKYDMVHFFFLYHDALKISIWVLGEERPCCKKLVKAENENKFMHLVEPIEHLGY